MKQFVLTPAAGKRLIAKAMVKHPAVRGALESGTLVIIAGTTNGYVAEEVLAHVGQSEGFAGRRFFRGITPPPSFATTESGRLPDESEFPGDVVIVRGAWQKGKTIFDVVDDLKEGDAILKGANAVDLSSKRAGLLIGHPKGGTIVAALKAVVGRRVRLIVPVGLEKRISTSLDELAAQLNAPGARGPRFLPIPGEVVTEIEAVSLLTGATAELVAAGGVCGAEGAAWLAVAGDSEQEKSVETLMESVSHEPPFVL
ncbi:hypothetical protein JW916_11645 [Candidatus Sumerlaeota bacterium]|nr:hypothetical protein [Candidatus Sumerlaeota bacterium]